MSTTSYNEEQNKLSIDVYNTMYLWETKRYKQKCTNEKTRGNDFSKHSLEVSKMKSNIFQPYLILFFIPHLTSG